MLWQVEKAQSVWDEFESESGQIKPLISKSGQPVGACGGSGSGSVSHVPSAPKAKAKAKTSAKNRTTANAIVVAATLRARTAKDLHEAERNLMKAKSLAESLLDLQAPKLLGSWEEVAKDPTLDLLRNRLELVKVALSDADTAEGNLKLFQLCLSDPYLKDCRSTLLADESACQTRKSIEYERKVTMDLYLSSTFFEGDSDVEHTILSVC